MNARDIRLDCVKGVLVVVMVIYHVLNYFSSAGQEIYGYLRFVNGAFIFLSGYIVTLFYQDKYEVSRSGTVRRLVGRGLRLLAIFTALNLAIAAVGAKSYQNVDFGLEGFTRNIYAIYVTGDGRLMAFQILVPIAYLLILSPLYLLLGRWNGVAVGATLIVAALSTLVETPAPNLVLGLIGLCGIAMGRLVDLRTLPAIRNRLLLAALLALSCIAMDRLSANVLSYSIGIVFVLKLTYDYTLWINPGASAGRVLAMLGQYSLVGYLAQIMFIYVVYRLTTARNVPVGLEVVLMCVLTTGFLIALCSVLEAMRRRSVTIDRLYRAVFA